MGILQKILLIRQKVDPESIEWVMKQIEMIPDLLVRKSFEDKLMGENWDYKYKMSAILHSIYGVDIQPIAVELSKLRFFLTLMVDETVNDAKLNRGINSLPNLSFKFVAANSLIGLGGENETILRNIKMNKKFNNIREQYFSASTSIQKKEIEIEFRNLQKELRELTEPEHKQSYLFDDFTEKKSKIKLIDSYFDKLLQWYPFEDKKTDWFDKEWMFGLTDGFDIIIGNPPFVRADNPSIAEQRKLITESKQYVTLWEKWDLMVPFVEKGLKLLKKNGVLTYILSNSITTSKFTLKLHNWILKNHFVRFIDYFENISVFDAGVIPVIISLNNSKQNEITYKNFRTDSFSNVITKFVSYKKKENLREKVFKKTFSTIFFPEIDVEKLGDICYLSVGMVTNADEKNAKGEFTKSDLISNIKTDIFCKEYVEGKNIKEYSINKIRYLEYNTHRVPHKLRRPTFPELYIGEKILRGRVTKGTFDNTGIFCNDSIVVAKRFIDLKGVKARSISTSIAKNNFDFKGSKSKAILTQRRIELEKTSDRYLLKYILSVINSKYAMGYLNNFRRHRLKNYFYPDDFRRFPIPQIELKQQIIFETLVNQILIDKKAVKDTQILEDKIDLMVYKLYEEIKIVDPVVDKVLSSFSLSKEDYERMSVEKLGELEV